jgi:threonine dehydrogenase-like Zn-dependent dehydrogenase
LRADVLAGLNALAAAKAFGATKIAITDVRDDNLALAKSLGAKHALLTPPSMTNEDAAELVKTQFPPEGPDCVIDCAGYSSTLNVSPPPSLSPTPLGQAGFIFEKIKSGEGILGSHWWQSTFSRGKN